MHILDMGWAVFAILGGSYPIYRFAQHWSDAGAKDLVYLMAIFTAYPTAVAAFHLTPFDKGLADAILVFAVPMYFSTMMRYLGYPEIAFANARRAILACASILALSAVTNTWHGQYAVYAAHIAGEAHHLMAYEVIKPGLAITISFCVFVVLGTSVASFWRIVQSRIQVSQLLFGVGAPVLCALSPLVAAEWLTLSVNLVMLMTILSSFLFTYWLVKEKPFEKLPVPHARVISVIPDPVIITNSENCVVDCNTAFAELCGLSQAQVIGTPLADLLPNSEVLICAESTNLSQQGVEYACLQGEKTRNFDVKIALVDGESSSANSSGQTSCRKLMLLRDITELSVTLLELQYSESQLVAANEELARLSNTDALTGLNNRRYFQNRLEADLTRINRYGGTFGLLAIDIDHFKRVNDQYGHAVGDHALIHIARVLEMECRSSDMLARTGGEEFVILLAETDDSQLTLAAERFRRAVASTPIPIDIEDNVGQVKINSESIESDEDIHQATLSLSISVGATVVHAHDSMRETLSRVDELLYVAKGQGRNRTAVDADSEVTILES